MCEAEFSLTEEDAELYAGKDLFDGQGLGGLRKILLERHAIEPLTIRVSANTREIMLRRFGLYLGRSRNGTKKQNNVNTKKATNIATWTKYNQALRIITCSSVPR